MIKMIVDTPRKFAGHFQFSKMEGACAFIQLFCRYPKQGNRYASFLEQNGWARVLSMPICFSAWDDSQDDIVANLGGVGIAQSKEIFERHSKMGSRDDEGN